MIESQRIIKDWVNQNKKTKSSQVAIEKIPGDASARQYFRIKSGTLKMIAMKMNPFASEGLNLPFVQVQRHLENLGIPVPKIMEVDPDQGLLILSDLGDETFLKRLETVSKKRDQLIWFKRAVDLLVSLQSRATRQTAPIDSYGLFFDEDKLMWEVGFTLKYFYNGKLTPEMSAKDQTFVEKSFKDICKTLSSEPWFFTHRDYHSRNIMIHDEKLFMIDFQDARMGCAQYDLASLLRDSYYQLEEELIYELVDYYYEQMTKAGFGSQLRSKQKFTEIFDLMSIQRNFKAIGSFASFYVKREDARYVKFIGNTFENIRRNLLKFPELDGLRRILFKYYYF